MRRGSAAGVLPTNFEGYEVTRRSHPCIVCVTTWHTTCCLSGPPGMRLDSPAVLVAVPLACVALWLSAAVADAQQVNVPGTSPPHVPSPVSQVVQAAKPAVAQAVSSTTSQPSKAVA